MATIGNSYKVASAVSGATTVPAASWAVVDYGLTADNASGIPHSVTRHFGPGQSVPGSFNLAPTGATNTATYTLLSGVIFTNT